MASDVILEMQSRSVRYVAVERPYHFASPYPDEQFSLLICNQDENLTQEEKQSIAEEIVKAGCRFVACWGKECGEIETAVDCAYIETDPDFSPPEETFILTTAHEDEGIEEAVDYWWMNSSFDNYTAKNFAVLMLGVDDALATRIKAGIEDLAGLWEKSNKG